MKNKEKFCKNLIKLLLNFSLQMIRKVYCHIFSEIKPSNDVPDGYFNDELELSKISHFYLRNCDFIFTKENQPQYL